MNVQIHPRFMLLLILTSFFRGEFGPSGGGGARWWSGGGGDPQATLQFRPRLAAGGDSGNPSVTLHRRGLGHGGNLVWV